jgi:hydrophobic/amphiphilic exporter-1 (mainly G- bacteria), HAE1 family
MHLLSVFSLRNRALIALLTIVIGVFGVVSLGTLKQELFPSIDAPQIFIASSYPGASPAVVDHDVSTPIETGIQGVEGIDTTTSTSQAGSSTVNVTLKFGTDTTTVEQKIQLAIDQLNLPQGVNPKVIAGSIADIPVVQLAVTSDLNQIALTNALNKTTIDSIQALDGVRQATLLGTLGQRVTITPDVDKLSKQGLTVQSITAALQQNGSLLASGTITEEGKSLVVQSGDQITSVNQLREIPLIGSKTTVTPGASAFAPPTTSTSPVSVSLGSVSDVKLTTDPRTGISRVNGKPSLTIAVTKTPDGNTVAVSKAIRAEIPNLEVAIGHNTKFTVVFDQAPYIQSSINDLAEEGLFGLVFAILVILLFLWSWRATVVTAISIPVSVLIAFIGMLGAGYTLNIITLAALTIAIGRVVDDSIVVIENIKRHLSFGEQKMAAILAGVREVATAVTASTLTTVAVFLPLGFVTGETGELFQPFALTVTIALVASLFVALTIVPVLAYWFLRNPKQSSDASVAPRSSEIPPPETPESEREKPTRLQRVYLPIIRWTTRGLLRPLSVIAGAIVILILTVFLASGLQTNFIGSSGQNTLSVTQKLPLGSSLAAEDTAARKVENTLLAIKGIKTVQASIGSGGNSLAAAFGGGGGATSFSVTTDASLDQTKLQATVDSALKKLKGAGTVQLAASQGFTSNDITITVKARSDASLRVAATDIYNSVKDLSVTQQASSNLSAEQPYIGVVVDRDKAAKDGLSELAVGSTVTASMNPGSSGSISLGDTNVSVYIKDADQPMTVDELGKFQITTATGKKVDLDTIATVSELNGPASITTIKGVRSATITVTPKGNATGTASAEVQTAVTATDLPPGATAELGGVTSQQSDAFKQLGLALLAAILIVYVIMVATFKSLLQPLLLLVSIPFAATGAIVLQLASGTPLGVSSIVGVLMLVGIVVTNAIVLVDLINQYRRHGYTVAESVINGTSRRLRPILMTATATIFALLPMAVGLTGKGSFISQPLAIVVIGGLISSTILTLVVLPVLYKLVEGGRERRAAKRAGQGTAPKETVSA